MNVILRYSEGSGTERTRRSASRIDARSFAALRMMVVGLVVVTFTCGCTGSRAPTIAVTSSTLVTVAGLDPRDLESFAGLDPAHQQAALQVHVAAAAPDAPPLLGDVARRGDVITFAPRYPFQPGLKYRARFDLVSPPLTSDFTLRAPARDPVARVAAVYPSADELPENLLKFYIHFSAPMSRGEAYQHVRLLDDRGQIVPAPFLELDEELWDPAVTRFTLFFDPGRIKHGLVPRIELGPAMVPGRSYTLVIDANWPDGEGRPLVGSFEKTFRTIPADTRQPDPSRWRVTPPQAGSTQALVIDFDEPLDHAMLQHVISVLGQGHRNIAGRVTITQHERQWVFTPDSPWLAGRYNLTIDPDLEDAAGNSIGRPFEVNLNQRPSPATQPPVVRISVDIAR